MVYKTEYMSHIYANIQSIFHHSFREVNLSNYFQNFPATSIEVQLIIYLLIEVLTCDQQWNSVIVILLSYSNMLSPKMEIVGYRFLSAY